jgi:hypothetical protein
MASKAISVSRRSMLSWVISWSWTKWGQPHRTCLSHLSEVQRLWLRQQDDIAFPEELLAGQEPCHRWPEHVVGYAEALAIAALKVDPFPQVSGNPLDVQRMDREPRSFSFRDRAMTPSIS